MVWNNGSIKINKNRYYRRVNKANGFDTGVGIILRLDTSSVLAKKIDLNTTSRVFEIGCGSGAFYTH